MGLLNLLTKFESTSSIAANVFSGDAAVDDALKRNPALRSMLNNTLAKAKAHGGDPFYEYREQGILPEKYEYGMNCLFDSLSEICTDEVEYIRAGKRVSVSFVQKIYDEMRKDPRDRILRDVSSLKFSTDMPGMAVQLRIPFLFGITLKEFVDFQNAAINRIKGEFVNNFFVNILLVRNSLNRAWKVIVPSKKVFLWRITFEHFVNNSGNLLNKMLFYKSKDKGYYDTMQFQQIKEGHAHGSGGFEVDLSEPVFSDIIVMLSTAEKDKHFSEAKELTEKEAAGISVVGEYIYGKPAYREGEKVCILEGDLAWREIDAIEYTDDAIRSFEDVLLRMQNFLDDPERVPTFSKELLQRLSEVVGYKESEQKYFVTTTLRKLKEEVLGRADDLTYELDMSEKQARIRGLELRLKNTDQVLSLLRKKVTDLIRAL